MNLSFNTHLAEGYKSQSQIARLLTEDWVLNNSYCPSCGEIPLKEFSAALGIEPLLVLPYEPQLFGTASNNGQMISDLSPQSKCSEGFDYLAANITGRAPARKEKSSVFDKLKIKLNK